MIERAPMNIPPPTEKQAKILWMAVTAVAVAVLLAIFGSVLAAIGYAANVLSPVLLPLAVAGVVAYLLDPVVDFFGRLGVPRARAILLVFALAASGVLLMAALAGPKLAGQARSGYVWAKEEIQRQQEQFLKDRNAAPKETGEAENNPANGDPGDAPDGDGSADAADSEEDGDTAASVVGRILEALPIDLGSVRDVLLSWGSQVLPVVGRWMASQAQALLSWAGLLVGLALVPVYAFYFLLEKKGISENWEEFLPLRRSWIKGEIAFVLRAINEHLIVFFRGQVLVAACIGVLLSLGFSLIGLEYAFLLGVTAGVLSIIPYLGIMLSLLPAITIGLVQSDGGGLALAGLVLVVFVLVQLAEGLVISPRIIGDRIGLHPLTVIIAVMAGTSLMGGIVGGILAIPLTASLKVLMFRYVWTGGENNPLARKPPSTDAEDD